MASVVIIHAAEDTLPARALAEKLRQAQLEVTLERQPGDELRNAVKSAQVTIALWSPRSVSQPQLADEVAFARGKSKLVHAAMQSAAAPDQFRSDQVINLTGWRGEDEFPAWRELANNVLSKAGMPPLPPPTPRPPSGFFQPGAPTNTHQPGSQPAQAGAPQQARQQQQRGQPQQAPRQQAQAPRQAPPRPSQTINTPAPEREKKGGGNMMVIGLIALVVIGLGGGGAYWWLTQNPSAPGIAQVDLTSASAIRDFLASDPAAEDRAAAEEALETLEQQSLDAARDANTVEAFEGFLRDFPDSDEALFVQGQIQQLRLQEASGPPLAPEEGVVDPSATPETDPDLVPPTAETPAPSGEGPASLAPPETPAEEPADAPVTP